MSNVRNRGAAVAAILVAIALTCCAPSRGPSLVTQELACIAPPVDGIPVQVIDTEGRPVAAAFVTWFAHLDEASADLAPEPELSRLRRTLGTTVRTDRDGSTRVGEFDVVVASSNGTYAGRTSFRRHLPNVLVLRPARSITVLTVDREQRPVSGVPVEMTSGSRVGTHKFGWDWRVRSDAAGVVTFGPIDLFAPSDPAESREIVVAVDAPMRERRLRRLAGHELPREPIRFEMPPTGSLVLDVFDEDGRPLDEEASVGIGVASDLDAGGPANLSATEPRRRDVMFWTDLHAGHLNLPHIEAGMPITVDVDRASSEYDLHQRTQSPPTGGQVVTVRLVGSARPRLSARILDDRGAPVADRDLEWDVACEGTRHERSRLGQTKSDDGGRVSIVPDPFTIWRTRKQERAWIAFALRDPATSRVTEFGEVEVSRIPNDKEEEAAVRDLGDVHLRAATTIATGVVIDDVGAPVAGVRLELKVGRSVDDPPLYDFELGDEEFPDALLWSTSSADGTFEIRGDEPRGDLSIRCSSGTSTRAFDVDRSWRPVPQRGVEARFVVQRLGTVVGRIVGPRQELDEVAFGFSGDASGGSPSATSRTLDLDGSFECFLPAGKWTMKIRPAGEGVFNGPEFELKPDAVVTLPTVDLVHRGSER